MPTRLPIAPSATSRLPCVMESSMKATSSSHSPSKPSRATEMPRWALNMRDMPLSMSTTVSSHCLARLLRLWCTAMVTSRPPGPWSERPALSSLLAPAADSRVRRSSGNSTPVTQRRHAPRGTLAPWLTSTLTSVRSALLRTSGRPSRAREASEANMGSSSSCSLACASSPVSSPSSTARSSAAPNESAMFHSRPTAVSEMLRSAERSAYAAAMRTAAGRASCGMLPT
mmetsp:Transcript_11833/g.41117  ORF Transcript_11833/g.41117 Transcript_11833/m.41117 type:complete len:228 (+) Transcript_11833:262-945(+)